MSLPPGAGMVCGVVAFNGAFAAVLDQLARHDLLHRHWLLPSLAAGLAYQWLASLLWPKRERAALEVRIAARSALLSMLAFVTALGIVSYPGVFSCRESCAARFGWAALLAGLVFWHQSQAEEGIFWDRLRSRLAAMGCGLWGTYLLLYHRQMTLWMLDIIFFILAMSLWLGRSQAVFLIASVGIVALAALRNTGNELMVVLLDLAGLTALFLGGGHWIEARLGTGEALAQKPWTPRRAAAVAGVFTVLAVYAARPAWLMVNPDKRRARLEGLAPAFPVHDPKTLSPLAVRLKRHVDELAGRIGERSAYLIPAQKKAQDYISARFRDAGYSPRYLEFEPRRKLDFLRREPCRNVEARLKGRDDGKGVWIVGAHYDTAPGTPGADDNASGIAMLLETARLLRERGYSGREIRFAAFDAEEPPAFGTRDMGSLRYADDLKDRGTRVRGMINLEMVGYFNPKPGAQLFPPFLQLFYPDRGDFVGLAGNLRSLSLGRAFARAWSAEGVPLLPATMPFVFSTLVISDQLNFWYAGCPALMLTDTAFFRNPNYHQDTDTPEKLDYERMAAQTEALVKILSSGL